MGQVFLIEGTGSLHAIITLKRAEIRRRSLETHMSVYDEP